MDFKAGGSAIQEARKRNNWTQEQLADRTELTSNTVSRIERDLLMPSVPMLCSLCNALNIGADAVLAPYIHADTQLRWSPLADRMEALPMSKQDKVEKILTCILETI